MCDFSLGLPGFGVLGSTETPTSQSSCYTVWPALAGKHPALATSTEAVWLVGSTVNDDLGSCFPSAQVEMGFLACTLRSCPSKGELPEGRKISCPSSASGTRRVRRAIACEHPSRLAMEKREAISPPLSAELQRKSYALVAMKLN